MENICRMRCLPHPSSPSLSEPCLSLSCLTKSPVCLLFILLLLILQSSHFLALSLCPKLGFSQFWVLFLHTPNKLTPSPVNFPCIWSQGFLCSGKIDWKLYSPQWFLQSTGWRSHNFSKGTEHLTQKVLEGRKKGRKEGKKGGRRERGDMLAYMKGKPENSQTLRCFCCIIVYGRKWDKPLIEAVSREPIFYCTCRLMTMLYSMAFLDVKHLLLPKDTITVLCSTMWHHIQVCCEM